MRADNTTIVGNWYKRPRPTTLRAVGDSFGTLFRITTFGESHGGAVGVEGFRLRRTGTSAQCDMTLRVPGEMAVRAAHAICDRIEDALRADDPDLGVVVHVEPTAASSTDSI